MGLWEQVINIYGVSNANQPKNKHQKNRVIEDRSGVYQLGSANARIFSKIRGRFEIRRPGTKQNIRDWVGVCER